MDNKTIKIQRTSILLKSIMGLVGGRSEFCVSLNC